MDPTNNTQLSRRRFLQTTGTAAAAIGLAGCSGDSNNQDTSTATETPSDTPTPTETDPLEQKHSAENLDTIIQELEQDKVTLNPQPANPNAEYADSILFTEYTGELDVEIDLSQAEKQRHHSFPEIWGKHTKPVKEFIQGVKNEDDEWLEQLHQQYLEETDGENLLNLQKNVDWETYKDQSLNLDKRIQDSGLHDLWYKLEVLRYDGISSGNNMFKAQALQETEVNAGFDTFIWDYQIPGHGLISAIENPTRKPEQTENQETYIIETDQGREQQVVEWENSNYKQKGLHPARTGKEEDVKAFYATTATGQFEDFHGTYKINKQTAKQFTDFYNKPETSPAHKHLDPMTATAYIAEENILNGKLDGKITLDTDTITFQT